MEPGDCSTNKCLCTISDGGHPVDSRDHGYVVQELRQLIATMLEMDAALLCQVPRGTRSRCLVHLEFVGRWLFGTLGTFLCQILIHGALFFHSQLREVVDELTIEQVELGLTLRP